MNTFPRLFVYEVCKRTGPAVNEFYCYAIYSSKTHHIICCFKEKDQRAARKTCDNFIGTLTYSDEVSIVVWRDWPILLWSDELTEQAMVEKIRKREVSS